jgi:hypothetical protein
MKIGLISDTHGDLSAWEKAVAGPFRGADLILHAGDILYHGPKNPMVPGYAPAALAEAINRSPAPVILVRGNCDSDVDQLVLDYPIQAPYALVQIEGLRVLVNHGDGLSREEMIAQAQRYRATVFVSGHTHIPGVERVGDVILVNPGSPALPKGAPPRLTVAVIEDRSLRLLDLDRGQILQEVALH